MNRAVKIASGRPAVGRRGESIGSPCGVANTFVPSKYPITVEIARRINAKRVMARRNYEDRALQRELNRDEFLVF